MRRLLPSRVEVAIFAVLAVIASASVTLFQPNTHDLSMAAFAGPIFLFAAVLGLRRSPVWTAAAEEEEAD